MEVPTRQELRRRRLELGLTQRVVAQRAGISQPLVARIERGSVDPRVSTLTKIVQVLSQVARDPRWVARDVMAEEVVAVRPKDTVRRAATVMNRGGFSVLPVLDRGHLVGSISERRIVEELSRAEDLSALARRSVDAFLQPAPPQVPPDCPMDTLSRLLDEHPMVMVSDRGRILGVVTEADLLGTIGRKPPDA